MGRPTVKIKKGEVFGLWTVISDETVLRNKQAHKECVCACGVERLIPTNELVYGKTKSCRKCAAKKKIKTLPKGAIYKEWQVTGRTKQDKYNNLIEVKCLCCNVTALWMTYATITRKDGSFKCKKCAKKDAVKTFLKTKGIVGDLRQGKYSKTQRGAKARGIEYTVSKEYLWELYLKQDKVCALTGDTICDINKASLDRINSSKGYVEGNVQWVTVQANLSKHTMTTEEFVEFCKKVINKQRSIDENRIIT